MAITATGHFGITTTPRTGAPEGRTWGAHHWDFIIIASGSGEVYSGVYSAGEAKTPEYLHADILQSIAMDAVAALEGEGDLLTTLEVLEGEGLGYGLAEGYKVARELIGLHDWVASLTDDERDELEEAQYDE